MNKQRRLCLLILVIFLNPPSPPCSLIFIPRSVTEDSWQPLLYPPRAPGSSYTYLPYSRKINNHTQMNLHWKTEIIFLKVLFLHIFTVLVFGLDDLFVVWTCCFCVKVVVPFPLSMAKQYANFNNRKRAPNNFKFFTLSIRISYSRKGFGVRILFAERILYISLIFWVWAAFPIMRGSFG